MFFLKACPKCQGDMYQERDLYGTFVECLQCGLMKDVRLAEAFFDPSDPVNVGFESSVQREPVALSA